jgi:hypothetical protein
LCHSFHSLQSRRVNGENHWHTSICTVSTSTLLGYVIHSFISFIAIMTRKWRKSLAHIHLYHLLIHRTFVPHGLESCPRGSRLSSCHS